MKTAKDLKTLVDTITDLFGGEECISKDTGVIAHQKDEDFLESQMDAVRELAYTQTVKMEEENPKRVVCGITHGGGACVTIASIAEEYINGFVVREHITKTITPVSPIEKKCVEVMKRIRE